MPVEFLSDRHRLNRVGRIRLGHKATNAAGKEYPVADPFFNLPDELKAFYPAPATTLNIRFISNQLEDTFPHYLRWYTKSRLRCLGDGQGVIYQVSEAGVKTVDNYAVLDEDGKVVMNGAGPTRQACEGETCPQYIAGCCKPTGYLRFVVVENLRQGYYDVVCHQRAVVGIKTQLELCLRMFGRLVDIPFLLHRGEAEQVAVQTPSKGIVNMPVRTQWIEIEPTWFQTAFMRRPKVLVESAQQRQLEAQAAIALLYPGQDSAPASAAIATPIADFSEPAFEGEGDEEPEPAPVTYPAETAAPAPVKSEQAPEYAAIDIAAVKTRLAEAAAKYKKGGAVTEGQRGLLVGKIQEALQAKDDKLRHLITRFLWGKEGSRDLTYGEVGAMLKWLVDGQNSTGDYPLRPESVRELLAIARNVQIEAGQHIFEFSEEATE